MFPATLEKEIAKINQALFAVGKVREMDVPTSSEPNCWKNV